MSIFGATKTTAFRVVLWCAQLIGVIALAAAAQLWSKPLSDLLPDFICSTENAGPPEEVSYLAENDAAMRRMMRAMTIKPTGSIDRDFVLMMTPHHQAAIDMAQAVLRHGHNEQIRRLAQEIIVTQQQEIIAMRLAVGDGQPPTRPAVSNVENPSRPYSALVQPRLATP